MQRTNGREEEGETRAYCDGDPGSGLPGIGRKERKIRTRIMIEMEKD